MVGAATRPDRHDGGGACTKGRCGVAVQSTALRHNRDFLKLWAGESISLVGSQITTLALPLVAVVVLDAGPLQMGALGAAQYAPFLLFGLIAGVWVDRMRRRPVLIWTDVGRAALLASIPVSAALGLLRIEQIYLVAFASGVLTVFFDVAYQAFLPSLVHRDELVEGNSKLELSRSVAQIAGPGLGGGLVQFLTAPLAVAVDSASYLFSALFLALIRTPEPSPTSTERQSVRAEIAEGIRLVIGNPVLRANAGCTGTWNLFSSVIQAVIILYATRDLGLQPATLGVVLAAGGPGAILGALFASPAARRLGVGPTIIVGAFLGGVGTLLFAFAGRLPAAVAPMMIAGWFIGGVGGTAYNVTTVSLRQAITPDHLQGRMNATMRFLIWGTIPLGSLLGGALGETIGLGSTLVVGALGVQASFLWPLLSPLRKLREPPPVRAE
jgi:MFS family permease